VTAPKIAQVRLQPDERIQLGRLMSQLDLSTSDALREGLRLLVRREAEIAAAEEIRAFYEDQPVPLPDGVAVLTDAELEAADEAEW
jgi:propanediol utilization protein